MTREGEGFIEVGDKGVEVFGAEEAGGAAADVEGVEVGILRGNL